MSEQSANDELRDELPEDLNAVDFDGEYLFPDNSRRRIPGVIYVVLGAACLGLFLVRGDGGVFVNGGFLLAAVVLIAAGVLSITSGWRMTVDETQALVAAGEAAGFAVGHASAQQVWRGVRSRPTWRVLCYSAEDPPRRRGLVLVDAVDGRVVEHMVEDVPDDDRAIWGSEPSA
jgi:hypothetical protein